MIDTRRMAVILGLILTMIWIIPGVATACEGAGEEEIAQSSITFSPPRVGIVPSEPSALKVTMTSHLILPVEITKNIVMLPFIIKATTCKATLAGFGSCVDEVTVPAGTPSGEIRKLEFKIKLGGQSELFTYALESK